MNNLSILRILFGFFVSFNSLNLFETHEDMNKYFKNDNEKIIPDIDLKPKFKLIIP